MTTRNSVISCAAGLALACPIALAGPVEKDATNQRAFRGVPARGTQASPEQANYTENFDSYTAGRGVIGEGGWEAWYSGGGDGLVDTTHASSPSNSLSMELGADVVQRFTITGGMWEFTIQSYVPSSAPEGDGVGIILLNQYGGPDNWSMQLMLNENYFSGSQLDPYMIESQWDGALLPLIMDEWVEIKAVIDLENDLINTFYGGTPLGVDLSWTVGTTATPGDLSIVALDLWSSSSLNPPTIWLDSISLVEMGGCPCACDVDTSSGPGVCDIFDFLGFQNAFVGGEACACDIDTSSGPGVCDIFDFLAFQDQFVGGCP